MLVKFLFLVVYIFINSNTCSKDSKYYNNIFPSSEELALLRQLSIYSVSDSFIDRHSLVEPPFNHNTVLRLNTIEFVQKIVSNNFVNIFLKSLQSAINKVFEDFYRDFDVIQIFNPKTKKYHPFICKTHYNEQQIDLEKMRFLKIKIPKTPKYQIYTNISDYSSTPSPGKVYEEIEIISPKTKRVHRFRSANALELHISEVCKLKEILVSKGIATIYHKFTQEYVLSDKLTPLLEAFSKTEDWAPKEKTRFLETGSAQDKSEEPPNYRVFGCNLSEVSLKTFFEEFFVQPECDKTGIYLKDVKSEIHFVPEEFGTADYVKYSFFGRFELRSVFYYLTEVPREPEDWKRCKEIHYKYDRVFLNYRPAFLFNLRRKGCITVDTFDTSMKGNSAVEVEFKGFDFGKATPASEENLVIKMGWLLGIKLYNYNDKNFEIEKCDIYWSKSFNYDENEKKVGGGSSE